MGEIRLEDIDLKDLDGPDDDQTVNLPPEGDDPGVQAAKRAAKETPPEGGDDPNKQAAEGGDPTSPQQDDWGKHFSGDEFKDKSPAQVREMFNTYRQIAENAAAFMRQQPGPQPPQQQQQQPTPQDQSVFEDDEDIALMDGRTLKQKLDKFFELKSQPIIQETNQRLLQGAIINSYNQAKSLPYFEKYNAEIMAFAQNVAQTNPADLASPGAWRMIHDHVAQQHMDEIVNERINAARQEQIAPPFTETGAGSGRPASNGTPRQAAELSALDREIADGLNIPHAVFAQMKSIRGG